MELELRTIESGIDEQLASSLSDMKSSFGEMLKSELFTDVTVKCGTVEILTHKIVLAVRVPFFKEALLHDGVEKQTIEVPPEISSHIVRLIIDNAYFVLPEITSENVQALLEAAAYLRIEDLWRLCDQFINKRIVLTVQNCFSVQRYADAYSANLLKKTVDGFGKHFTKIFDSHDFRRMSLKEIILLLSVDGVDGLTNEELFWEVLVEWIQADVDSRESFMPQLLKHVRLPCFTIGDIVTKVLPHPLIDRNSVCRQMIQDLLSYKVHPSNAEIKQKCSDTFCFQPRRIYDVVYFLSSDCESRCVEMQELPRPDGDWIKKSNFLRGCEVKFSEFQSMGVGSIIYLAVYPNTLISYNTVTETWTVIEGDEGRPEELYSLHLCSLHGKLGACKFEWDSNCYSSILCVYYYNASSNVWKRKQLNVGEAETKRSVKGVCGATNGESANEIVCILIESNCDSWGSFCNMYVFNLESGCLIRSSVDFHPYYWTNIASYNEKVFSVCTPDDEERLEACDDEGRLPTAVVKVYDVALDEWSSLAYLNDRNIRLLKLFVANNRLYVINEPLLHQEQRLVVRCLDLTNVYPHWQHGQDFLSGPHFSWVSSAVCQY